MRQENREYKDSLFVDLFYQDETAKRNLLKVININSNKAHNLLKKCDVLREYSQFIDTVRKYSQEEDAIKKAIDECVKKGILADYLARKGSEVANMLVAEYSYEEDIEVKQEEAREQGLLLSGKICRMVKDNPRLEDEQIAKELRCKTDEVESVRKMFGM